MSAEDIARLIAHSKKGRDVAEFEDKLPLSDGDRVTLNYVAKKLQIHNAEFHQHHYKLLDLVEDLMKHNALQEILNDQRNRLL